MRLSQLLFYYFTTIVFFVNSGCYPDISVRLTERKNIPPDTLILVPTKAFLADASIIMFSKGFRVLKDSIEGEGIKISLDRSYSKSQIWRLPIDSVAAVTSYSREMSVGRVLASGMHGIFSSIMTPMSLYCVSCPKCCFGSCPTVYTHDGTTWHLEAELFSSSISKLLEDNDTDLLMQKVEGNGNYQLRVTNEALETHHINAFTIEAAYHPIGTRLLLSEKGNPVILKRFVTPIEVTSRIGSDVLNFVKSEDSLYYRSDLYKFSNMMHGVNYDWLEVHTTIPDNIQKVRMSIRMRNTLMSTILLYEVVLASQGISALNWIERMNTDQLYASQFKQIYDEFSGIKVLVKRDDNWEMQSLLFDAGPITWKNIVTDVQVGEDRNIQIRLQFVPDNVMIDFIGFDYEYNNADNLVIEPVKLLKIQDNHGYERDDLRQLIEKDDDQYLITEPGDSYRFIYHVRQRKDLEATIFIRSKGYYVEWIRGSWLRRNQSYYKFDLSDIDQTFNQLVFNWLMNKELVERTFFSTRIPVLETQ